MHEVNKFIINKYEVDITQELPYRLPIDRGGIIQIFRELAYKTGAEIGVDTGWFSKKICKRTHCHLHCVDPWIVYDGYVEQKGEAGEKFFNKRYETARGRLEPYGCNLMRAFSMDAVKEFEDGSLDFVYIDGNHTFEYVIEDIAQWSKKVRSGGIISGHDFWNSIDGHGLGGEDIDVTTPGLPFAEKIRLCQVKDAVQAWTKANCITPWFLTGLDDFPSWLWVKE